MAFTWRSISGDIEDADHDEIRDNLDTVLTELGTSWPWSNISGEGEQTLSADVQELRDATDFASEQNYCRFHDSAHDSSVKSTVDTSALDIHYSPHDSNYYNGQDGWDHYLYDGTDYPGHLGTYYSGNLPNYYSSYHPGHYPAYYDGHFQTNELGVLIVEMGPM